MGKILDGRLFSNKQLESLGKEVSTLRTKPGLAVVIVGDDPASHIYVNNKERVAKKLGFFSKKIVLKEETTQEKLLSLLEELNENPLIHGILVQSPLPKDIDEDIIVSKINPLKDVDCFHPYNLGKVLIGSEGSLLNPCTPYGCLLLLEFYGISLQGKHCVVVGRSNIVGKPMAALLMQKNKLANATVSVVHSQTKDLADLTRQADILIVAIGKAGFIKADMVKEGVVVIDVGINKIEDSSRSSSYRLVGDVDFDSVASKSSFITPVPGGIGPVTIAILMKNTLIAYNKIEGKNEN